MATSGKVQSNQYNNLGIEFNWSRTSYSIDNNTTTIYYELKGYGTRSGYYTSGNFYILAYYDGANHEIYSSSTRINLYSGTVITSGYITIPMNSDGTGSFAAYIEAGIYQMAVNCTGRGEFTLDTVPRKSLLYAADGKINSTNVKFTIDRKSSSFRDSIYYVNPSTNAEVLIVNKTADTIYNWSPPDTLYQYFPNAKSIYLTFKSYTYNGSTLVGSDTAHAYVYANETNCEPSLAVTLTPTDYSSLTGDANTLIKGISNLSVLAVATVKNNATINKIVTNDLALTVNSSTGTRTFTNVDIDTFTTVVTDSRGFTKTDTQTLDMVDYIPLTVTANVYRVNATSDTVKAIITGNYFNDSFGSQSNTLSLTWKWKRLTDQSYTNGGTLTATYSNETYTTGEVTLGTGFDYDKDYDFLIEAEDLLLSKSANPQVRKGLPIFDYGVDSNGDNYFNVNGAICKNNENVLQRHIMTIVKNTNQDIAPGQAPVIVQMNEDTSSIGSKLTFTNNSVKIGTGVSYVLVSGLCWAEQNNGYKWLTIRKKSGSTYTTEASSITPRNINEDWDSVVLPPTLIDVIEDDEISMWIATTGSTTGRVSGQTYPKSTYLTVEVVK